MSAAGEVFDALREPRPDRRPRQRGRTHRSPRRHRRRRPTGDQLVIADTRDQVARPQRRHPRPPPRPPVTSLVSVLADHVTRRWRADRCRRPGRHPPQRPRPRRRQPRHLDRRPASARTAACTSPAAPANARSPPTYVREHVELAYATTAYGAQGETVDTAHLAARRDHRRRLGVRRHDPRPPPQHRPPGRRHPRRRPQPVGRGLQPRPRRPRPRPRRREGRRRHRPLRPEPRRDVHRPITPPETIDEEAAERMRRSKSTRRTTRLDRARAMASASDAHLARLGRRRAAPTDHRIVGAPAPQENDRQRPRPMSDVRSLLLLLPV